MRIILTGGGTGGHIYPALAIARRIRETHTDAEILYIGTARGLERDIVPRAGFAYQFIEVEGLRRSLSIRAVKTAWLAMTSVFAARKIIRTFKPDVVVGTGGYVVAPVVFAAYSVGVPTAILEMDAYAGLANRLVARFVSTVMLAMDAGAGSFAKAHRVIVTGNPRASEVVAVTQAEIERTARELRLAPGVPLVTIVGGSRGASPINRAVLDWLRMQSNMQFQVVWVTGQVHYDALMEEARDLLPQARIHIVPFYGDMPMLLAQTAIFIGRAGGTTLAEITALGVPAILIPSPYVTHRHQDYNAQALVQRDAAVLVDEDALGGEVLHQHVQRLLGNPFRLASMHNASLALGRPDALDAIEREINALAHARGGRRE